MHKGKHLPNFFAFEGVEAAGKTTQIELLKNALEAAGYKVLITREPGGSPVGEKIRTILLDPKHHGKIHPMTSLLLFNASRHQWMHEIVIPSLNAGHIVLADRSFLSSIAYQGHAEGLDLEAVRNICFETMGDMLPWKIFLLDIGLEEMRKRMQGAAGEKTTRYDKMGFDFHDKVRRGYLMELGSFPLGFIERIDGEDTIEAVAKTLTEKVLAEIAHQTQPC